MAERDNNRGGRGRREEQTPEFADRLVAINRVSKTVKAVSALVSQRSSLLATKKAVLALVRVRRRKFLRRSAKLLSKPSVR